MRVDRCRRHVQRQREDDGSGDDALHRGKDDLFRGDGGYGQWTHDAVVDLARNAELLSQRQRDGGDAAEHNRNGHESRQQHGGEIAAGHLRSGVHRGAAGHVRHDVGKDEQEEQRIHADAYCERKELAPQHIQVSEQ